MGEAPAIGMDNGKKESEMDVDIFRFASAWCSWNARALFTSCYMPRAKAVRKMQIFKQLCCKFAVTMLQEVHGTRFDEDTLCKEVAKHRHFFISDSWEECWRGAYFYEQEVYGKVP